MHVGYLKSVNNLISLSFRRSDLLPVLRRLLPSLARRLRSRVRILYTIQEVLPNVHKQVCIVLYRPTAQHRRKAFRLSDHILELFHIGHISFYVAEVFSLM
jgi:hypothetical protein